MSVTVSPPLIELDHASVMRGPVEVLHELSLSIGLGQHTVILGANGCGKSTFIKLITRELYPLAREDRVPVRLFGQERWNVFELRHCLGIVSNDLTRDLQKMPTLRVEDAVLSGFFATQVINRPEAITAAMRERAREVLEQVHAARLATRLCAELSTGEMRRVLIARALVNRPQALLLDEPTSGLDLVAQQRFVDLIGELARQGITLVLVTHHIEEIVPEIKRVILLRGGRVFADGERDALLTAEQLSAIFDGPVQVQYADGRYSARVTAA